MTSARPRVLFSDIDGTLVHYEKHFEQFARVSSDAADGAIVRYASGEEVPCVALPSSSSGTGYISRRTISLMAELRRAGVVVALITGARSSTYVARRAALPDAEYEIFESGGRCIRAGQLDAAWTARLRAVVGDVEPVLLPEPPTASRQGTLWSLHDKLVREGWKTDTRSYNTQFRVLGDAQRFAREVVPQLEPLGLASSYNLGKADIYPAASGKASAAQLVLSELAIDASQAVALFDDDNDLELGRLCGHAYLPSTTHPNVVAALADNPHWTVTSQRAMLGTEEALQAILALATAKE